MSVDNFTLGATSSLRRNILEINTFLSGGEVEPAAGLRGQYHEALMEYGITLYRQGFRRGHRESFECFLTQNAVPLAIRTDVRKTFVGLPRDVFVMKSKIRS
ncbi:MAG: hypothetical protein K2X07_00180 [Caulobacteraceae bacterium]|nr:hypothetical protein [Caulobacteraceae bacterium]